MLRCIIVDDEPLARLGLEKMIDKIPDLEIVAAARNISELKIVLENHKAGLVFLDIEMPGMNGIEALQTLTNIPPVILVTAYPKYAVKGFELNVIDYLVKPFSFERLSQAIQKVRQQIKMLKQYETESNPIVTYLFIKCDGEFRRINLKDILYVEAMLNYVTIYTLTQQHITYSSLKKIEEMLPKEQFMRIHKSYIVAIDKVASVKDNTAAIQEKLLPVSRSNKNELLKRLTI